VGFLTASVVTWHKVGNGGALGDLAELWAGASANGVTMVRRARCSAAWNRRQCSKIPLRNGIQTTAGGYIQKNGSLLTKFPQKLQEQDQKEYKTRIWIPRS
jgi:hypothetical protein